MIQTLDAKKAENETEVTSFSYTKNQGFKWTFSSSVCRRILREYLKSYEMISLLLCCFHQTTRFRVAMYGGRSADRGWMLRAHD